MTILYITTVSCTMNTFLGSHIKMLVQKGNQVDVASNFHEWGMDDIFNKLGCRSYQIDFSRSPLSLDNFRAYGQLKKVIENGKYDVVHCHTPNASVITRLVCRKFRKKNGLKVFYTAHGFHFYKGAPKLNWMIYYPVEKFCSRYTDKLITINREDYRLAQTKFKAKEVVYVPGVGVDLSRFEHVQVDRNVKRREIGVPEDAFLLLSVGELNENKNHQVIIKALVQLNNPKIHYAIAGVGGKRDYLLGLATRLGVSEQLHLLGYRKDIPELNQSADAFCFPSIREGLGVAAIEAMAIGIPSVVADNRGTRDIIENDKSGYLCRYDSVDDFAEKIDMLISNPDIRKALGERAMQSVEKFALYNILELMWKVYFE